MSSADTMSPPSTNRLVGTIELFVNCPPSNVLAETRLKNGVTVTVDDGDDLSVTVERVALDSIDILQAGAAAAIVQEHSGDETQNW